MHVVELKGGLGNQLFQWSLAAALRREGHSVELDPRPVSSGVRRLCITGLDEEVRLSSTSSIGIAASRRLGLPRTISGYRRIIEPHYHYWPHVFSLQGRCRLEGYWQSPRYFDQIADYVRVRITAFSERLLTDEGRALLERIKHDEGAVSVHVRRGDYVTDVAAAAHIGFVGLGYYSRAREEMYKRGGGAQYIFSDDLPWVQRHLAGPNTCFVPRSATVAAGGELVLMAACRGHIVANSSFSWWGAWLNSEPSLGVTVPAPWFRDESILTNDLVPDSWVQLTRDHATAS